MGEQKIKRGLCVCVGGGGWRFLRGPMISVIKFMGFKSKEVVSFKKKKKKSQHREMDLGFESKSNLG